MRASCATTIVLAAAVWLAASCDGGGGSGDGDGAVDGGNGPELASSGEDLDVHEPRELAASYELPAEFYDALEDLGLDPEDLFYPDAGSTYAGTPTRLHWTDTLRHDGQRAPTFGYMAAEDVAAALEAEENVRLRELLAAQYTYNHRDGFVTSRYDEQVSVTDGERPLLAALEAYHGYPPVEGGDPPESSWEEVAPALEEQLAEWPLATREALALAINGLVRAAELRDAALTGGDYGIAEWETLHASYLLYHNTYTHDFGTDAHPHVDFEQLNRAGQLALRVIEDLRLALVDAPLASGRGFELDGPLGRISVSLEDAATEWCGDEDIDQLLIVDGGGDDTYEDFVATNTSIFNPVSAVLDLAGNDTYTMGFEWSVESAVVPNYDPLQGAGIFGVAVLDDAGGDDLYHAPMLAQGLGIFGVGVLADHGGVDRYEGYDGAQGHAEFGFGLLVDLGGDGDSYETLQESQGYGGPRGIGWLVDDGGDDSYLAIAEPLIYDWAGEGSNWSGSQGFGYGVRDGFFTTGAPIFSGGLGALFDLGGDDDYQCAVMCQGFGYAFGAGLLHDAGGDDDHLITHKYATGAATHWAIGIYLDDGGADTYRNSGDDECIGLGYDASVAFHIDRGDETDVYTLDNFGDFAVGASRIPALGVLINEGGDDEYHIPGAGLRAIGRSRVEADSREGYLAEVINLGMFLDLGGSGDVYDIARDDVGNGQQWVQTEPDHPDEWDPAYDFGYGLDVD